MKAGFQIVDLNDIPLTPGTGVTVTGAYNMISGNNRKPYILSGVTVGNTKANSHVVDFTKSGDNYTADIAEGYTLTIAKTDVVTATTSAGLSLSVGDTRTVKGAKK